MLVGAAPGRRGTGTADGDERPMTGARAQIRRPSILLIALLALAGLALAGCGSSGGSGGSTSAAATKFVITIKDFGYTTPASVSPGATILVRNQDDTEHTVTADSGNAFDDQAPTGNSTFKAPTKPGSYPFHCTFHPEMHGTLVVK
jgi:plastocyanin